MLLPFVLMTALAVEPVEPAEQPAPSWPAALLFTGGGIAHTAANVLAVTGFFTFCGRRPCGDAYYAGAVTLAGVGLVAIVVGIAWLAWTR